MPKKQTKKYSAAEKRAYYIGYGVGASGKDVLDLIHDENLSSLFEGVTAQKQHVSFINGLTDAGRACKKKGK